MLAKCLREHGYACRRGQQFSGANGDADVVGLQGIHIECKFTQRLNIEDAFAQARRDAKPEELPVVMHKKNFGEWMVTLSLEDFLSLYKDWEGANA
jgi:hypothetical protein